MNTIIRIEGLDPNIWDATKKIRLVVLDSRNKEHGLAVDLLAYADWIKAGRNVSASEVFPNLAPTGWTLLDYYKPNVG